MAAPPPRAPLAGPAGRGAALEIPGRASEPVTYRAVEAGDLLPSHNPKNFTPNAEYPANVQERAYERSPEAQLRVTQQAAALNPEFLLTDNPDAVNGPPVVTPSGIVLGGNSRTMSIQRAYGEDRGAAYRNALIAGARKFGLDPKAVRAMRQPVLVRQTGREPGIEEARRLGSDLNRNFTGALGSAEMAASRGAMLGPDALGQIGAALDARPGESLRDLLRGDRGVPAILERAGAITARERPQFVDPRTGLLNEAGRAFAERAILGAVVPDAKTIEIAPASALNTVAGSLGPLASLRERGGEWDLSRPLTEALNILAEAQGSKQSVADIARQQGLFGAGADPRAFALAHALEGLVGEFRAALRQYAAAAAHDVPGQELLPGAARETPQDAFDRVFGATTAAQPTLARFFSPAPGTTLQPGWGPMDELLAHYDAERARLHEPPGRPEAPGGHAGAARKAFGGAFLALPPGEPNATEIAPRLPGPLYLHAGGTPEATLYLGPDAVAALKSMAQRAGAVLGDFGGVYFPPRDATLLISLRPQSSIEGLIQAALYQEGRDGLPIVNHQATPEQQRRARIEEHGHKFQSNADDGDPDEALGLEGARLAAREFPQLIYRVAEDYRKPLMAMAEAGASDDQIAQTAVTEAAVRLIIGAYGDLGVGPEEGDRAARTVLRLIAERWPDGIARAGARAGADVRARIAELGFGPSPHGQADRRDGGPPSAAPGTNGPRRFLSNRTEGESNGLREPAAAVRIASATEKDPALATAQQEWLARLQAAGRPAMASGVEGLTPGLAVRFRPASNGQYIAVPDRQMAPGEYEELAEAFAAAVGDSAWRGEYSANAAADERREALRSVPGERTWAAAGRGTLALTQDPVFAAWGAPSPWEAPVGDPFRTVAVYRRRGSGPGIVVVGKPGHAALAAAGMFRGGDPGFGGYGGFHATPRLAKAVIGRLEEQQAVASGKGDTEAVAVAAETRRALESALSASGSDRRGIAVLAAGQRSGAVRHGLGEEWFHGLQGVLAGGSATGAHIAEAAAAELLDGPLAERAKRALEAAGYAPSRMAPAAVVAEIGAKIAAGNFASLSLSREEAAEWFARYWRRLRAQHGGIPLTGVYLHQAAREAINDAESNLPGAGEERGQLGAPGQGGAGWRERGGSEGAGEDREREPPDFLLAGGGREAGPIRGAYPAGGASAEARPGSVARLGNAIAAPLKALDDYLSKYGGISPEAKTAFKSFEGSREMRAVEQHRLARDLYGQVFDTLGPNWAKDQASLLKIQRHIVRPEDRAYQLTPAEAKVEAMLLAVRDRITLHDVARGWLTPDALRGTRLNPADSGLPPGTAADLASALRAWAQIEADAAVDPQPKPRGRYAGRDMGGIYEPSADTPQSRIRNAIAADPKVLRDATEGLSAGARAILGRWIHTATPGVAVPYWPGSYTDDAGKVAKMLNAGRPDPARSGSIRRRAPDAAGTAAPARAARAVAAQAG